MRRLIALDTNAYTAYRLNIKTVTAMVDSASTIGVPVTVLGEIYFGAFNGSNTADNVDALTKFIASPRVEILHMDELTAKIFGEISAELRQTGSPVQQNDVWIAALCKQYDYPLLTADNGFSKISGLVVNTFKPQ